MSFSSACKQAILQIVVDQPMVIAEIAERLPKKLEELGHDFVDYYSHTYPEGSANQGASRLQVTARVLLAGLAKDSNGKTPLLLRAAPGTYQRNPDFVPDDAGDTADSDTSLAVALDEVELEEGASGCIYAFTYPAYAGLGWLKIGRAENLEVRMAQHLADAKKAAIPELPVLVQKWPTADPIALEKAVHGILKFRKKLVVGGAGTEWFKTTTQEVQAIIGFAAEENIPLAFA